MYCALIDQIKSLALRRFVQGQVYRGRDSIFRFAVISYSQLNVVIEALVYKYHYLMIYLLRVYQDHKGSVKIRCDDLA